MFACVCVCVYVWFAACWANCVVPVALDLVGATPTWQPSWVRKIRYVWAVFIFTECSVQKWEKWEMLNNLNIGSSVINILKTSVSVISNGLNT